MAEEERNQRFAGIDVGGRRKGFHAAALDHRRLVDGPARLGDVSAAMGWLGEIRPVIVALDSPMTCAEQGRRSRACERQLNAEICGIRWTPAESELAGNSYYEWVTCGLELYAAIERERRRYGWESIEVFPTASWTVWAGARGQASRARWSREALERMRVEGLSSRRLSQDGRDAVAAALTARLHLRGQTRRFGEIVVPAGPAQRS